MSDNWIEAALPLFREACGLSVKERTTFLDNACGADTELRRHVDAMLAWDDTGEGMDADTAVPHSVRAALDNLVQQAEPSPGDTAPLPESIGGHRIIRLIARGGMGAVYEAQQEHPRRRVAIKVAHTAGPATERSRRFELETQLLARLTHPGIAQIIEAGTTGPADGSRPFFVMEYVGGQTLAAYAPEHLLTARDKLQLIVRICEAVAFAHGQGVVHRDLKPDNVLIDADGKPKVLDFGVAKVEAAGGFGAATMRTEAGRIIGTLGYMAPEQLGGKTDGLGPQADVYSLGVMIYQLLSGRLPHELDGVELKQALAVVTNTDAPLLGVIRPEYRGDIEAVVAVALEKDARYRYADAAALQADLERFLRGEPVLARPAGPARKAVKWARRRPALAATVFALFLSLTTAAAMLPVVNNALDEYELIANTKHLENAILSADVLVPARREKVPGIEDWIDKYGNLANPENLAVYRATLEGLRARANDYVDESWTFPREQWQQGHDALADALAGLDEWRREHDELAGDMTDYQSILEDLRERARTHVDASWTFDDADLQRGHDALANLAVELEDWSREHGRLVRNATDYPSILAALRSVGTHVEETWIFDDVSLQLKHDVLARLVADLEVFGSDRGLATMMEDRRELAESIEQKTVGEWKAMWDETIERIRKNEKHEYHDLTISPQIGLIPLGPDPVSGLEEFLHYETHLGKIPTRDANGHLPPDDDGYRGLILVLIPGGTPGETFLMGGQTRDPSGDNYDPAAIVHDNAQGIEAGWEHMRERPTPDPFLLSKYEMTRGQWYRLTGRNPSAGRNRSPEIPPANPTKPVNKVSWKEIDQMMRRLGLTLPDEVQWEYAARAGTVTAFWTGPDASSLEGKENLFELAAADAYPDWSPRWDVVPAPWYDKQVQQLLEERRRQGLPPGSTLLPVGSYQPNAFGLYDVAGNLAEWTLHGPGFALNQPVYRGPFIHVLRGSSYKRGVKEARSASRRDATSDVFFDEIGVRPAMVIR